MPVTRNSSGASRAPAAMPGEDQKPIPPAAVHDAQRDAFVHADVKDNDEEDGSSAENVRASANNDTIADLMDGLVNTPAPGGDANKVKDVISNLQGPFETWKTKAFQTIGTLLMGTNRIGKTFLINLVLLMSCVTPTAYKSRAYKKAREALGEHKLEACIDADGAVTGTKAGEGVPQQHDPSNPREIKIIYADDMDAYKDGYTPEVAAEHRRTTYTVLRDHADQNRITDQNPWAGFIFPSAQQSTSTTTAVHNRICFGFTFHVMVIHQTLEFIRAVLAKIARDKLEKRHIDKLNRERWMQITDTKLETQTVDLLRGYADHPDTIPIHKAILDVAGECVVYAGKGDDLDADRWFVQGILGVINGKSDKPGIDQDAYKRRRFILQSLRTYGPCKILDGGVQIDDAPGLDDVDPLSKAVLRESEEDTTTRTVIGVVEKDVSGTETLINRLKESPFTRRLMLHPERHELYILLYSERTGSIFTTTIQDDESYAKHQKIWEKFAEDARSSIREMFVEVFQDNFNDDAAAAALSENETVDKMMQRVRVVTGFPVLYASLQLNEPLRRQLARDDRSMEQTLLERTHGRELFGIFESLNDAQKSAELMPVAPTLRRIEATATEEIERYDRRASGPGLHTERTAQPAESGFTASAYNQAYKLKPNSRWLVKKELGEFESFVRNQCTTSGQKFDAARQAAITALCNNLTENMKANDIEGRWRGVRDKLTKRNAADVFSPLSKGVASEPFPVKDVIFRKGDAPEDAVERFVAELTAAFGALKIALCKDFAMILEVKVPGAFERPRGGSISPCASELRKAGEEKLLAALQANVDGFFRKGRHDRVNIECILRAWHVACARAVEGDLRKYADIANNSKDDADLRRALPEAFKKTSEKAVGIFATTLETNVKRYVNATWKEIAGEEMRGGKRHARVPTMRRQVQFLCAELMQRKHDMEADVNAMQTQAVRRRASSSQGDDNREQEGISADDDGPEDPTEHIAYAKHCRSLARKLFQEIERLYTARLDLAIYGVKFEDRNSLALRTLELVYACAAMPRLPDRRAASSLVVSTPVKIPRYPGPRKAGCLRAPPTARTSVSETSLKRTLAASKLKLCAATGDGGLFDALVTAIYGEGLPVDMQRTACEYLRLNAVRFQAKAVQRGDEAAFEKSVETTLNKWVQYVLDPSAIFDELLLHMVFQFLGSDTRFNVWIGSESDAVLHQITSKNSCSSMHYNIAIVASDDPTDEPAYVPLRHTFRAVLPIERKIKTPPVVAPPAPPPPPPDTILVQEDATYDIVLDTSAIMQADFPKTANALRKMAWQQQKVVQFVVPYVAFEEVLRLAGSHLEIGIRARQRRNWIGRVQDWDVTVPILPSALRIQETIWNNDITTEICCRSEERRADIRIMHVARTCATVRPGRTLFWTDDKAIIIEERNRTAHAFPGALRPFVKNTAQIVAILNKNRANAFSELFSRTVDEESRYELFYADRPPASASASANSIGSVRESRPTRMSPPPRLGACTDGSLRSTSPAEREATLGGGDIARRPRTREESVSSERSAKRARTEERSPDTGDTPARRTDTLQPPDAPRPMSLNGSWDKPYGDRQVRRMDRSDDRDRYVRDRQEYRSDDRGRYERGGNERYASDRHRDERSARAGSSTRDNVANRAGIHQPSQRTDEGSRGWEARRPERRHRDSDNGSRSDDDAKRRRYE